VNGEGTRRVRILARLAQEKDSESWTDRLCEVCADVTDMSGAGIMLIADDVPNGSLCTTGTVSAVIEQLQYTFGEGPCVDAYRHDRPVLEPDLAEPTTSRWFAFSAPAVAAGVRAIFGFPMRVGAARIGALNLYRDRPGPLADDQHADAMVMADVASQAILAIQAEAPPGTLAAELEAGADLHYATHQAAGMVAAQLDVSVGTALIRLRAHAFGNERTLADLANDVVARRLRFDAVTDEQDAVPYRTEANHQRRSRRPYDGFAGADPD